MNRKKTAAAIQQEVAREIGRLLQTIFTGVRKTGHVGLEAMEMLVRSAMHQAGATAMTELLRFAVPDQRTIPCPCRTAGTLSGTALEDGGDRRREGGSLTARYLCAHCHHG